jgi:hypothetical protein
MASSAKKNAVDDEVALRRVIQRSVGTGLHALYKPEQEVPERRVALLMQLSRIRQKLHGPQYVVAHRW